MPKAWRALLAALLCAAAPGCASGPGGGGTSVRVYAALSLRPALTEAQSLVEEAVGAPVVFNFAASNHLARQILAAGQADLFLSADRIQMEIVERAGRLEPGTAQVFLSNRLVVITHSAHAPEIDSPEDLAGPAIRRLSIADPDGVPVGRYARLWLERRGLWERVSGRIVPALDARAAVAAVESGGAQAGVVYRTDAALSRSVRVVFEVPPEEGPEIEYLAAVIAGSPAGSRARAVIAALRGAGGREIFQRFGFVPPPRPAS